MDFDLDWPVEVFHRQGAVDRLCGIDVFHDFPWRDIFPDERTQFRNGKNLASFVQSRCAHGKTPALLLTRRRGETQGIRQSPTLSICVVNIDEYRQVEGSAALTYFAEHLDVDISDIEELNKRISAVDPELVRAFIEDNLDIDLVGDWAVDDPGKLKELRDLVAGEIGDGTLLTDLLAGARSLAELPTAVIEALTSFLSGSQARNLREVIEQTEVVSRLYSTAPAAFRNAIRMDASARDVAALAHRKAVVDEFRLLLTDDDAFAARQAAESRRGPEGVWQAFLEANPWILGIGLTGQLLTAWSSERLEQVVAGQSVAGPGKRVDALLRTAGRIRSLVLAEIKHHGTPLLGEEYRAGCWSPSPDVSGGVAQIQRTVQLAVSEISERLPDRDEDGAETGEATWLIRPRSFFIAGRLDELRGDRGVHPAKFESFELYRRNLYEPEVLTFDELLARAEWHVELAEAES